MITKGLENSFKKRYRDHKTKRKQHFKKHGGYNNIEMAENNPPGNVTKEEWKDTIKFFLGERHKSRSAVNSENRSLMPYPSLHGISTYVAARYKKKTMSATQECPDEIETWGNMHRKKSGDFVNEKARMDFESLVRERKTQIEEAGGSSSSVNDVDVMTKVLGERRGHNRGRGRKLTGASSSQSYEEHARVVGNQAKEIERQFNTYKKKSEKRWQASEMKWQAMMTAMQNIPGFVMPDLSLFDNEEDWRSTRRTRTRTRTITIRILDWYLIYVYD